MEADACDVWRAAIRSLSAPTTTSIDWKWQDTENAVQELELPLSENSG